MAGADSPGARGSAEMPVGLSNFGHLVDAAKQQTELIVWMAEKLQEHERKLAGMDGMGTRSASDGLSVRAWKPGLKRSESQAKASMPPLAKGEPASPPNGSQSRGSGATLGVSVSEAPTTAASLAAAAPADEEGAAHPAPAGPPQASPLAGEGERESDASSLESRVVLPVALAEQAEFGSSAPGQGRESIAEDSASVMQERVTPRRASVAEGWMEQRLEEFAEYMREELERAAEVSSQSIARLAAQMRAMSPRAASAAESPDSASLTRGGQHGPASPPGEPSELEAAEEELPAMAGAGAQPADADGPGEGRAERRGAEGSRPGSAAREGPRPASPLAGLESSEQLALVRGMAEGLQRQMDRIHVDELKDIRLEHVSMKADVDELREGVRLLEQELLRLRPGGDADEGAAELHRLVHRASSDAAREGEPQAAASAASEKRSAESEEDDESLGPLGGALQGSEDFAEVDHEAAQVVKRLEERLKTLEEEHRVSKAKLGHSIQILEKAAREDDENHRRQFKAWNLANQVDVIQSVVAEEMRHVRDEVRKEMRQAGPSTAGPLLRGPSPWGEDVGRAGNAAAAPAPAADRDKDMKEVEEKLRRLQECYQQNTLKIAGLKSATRAIEHSASSAMDKAKRVADDMDAVAEMAQRHEARLEFLARDGVGIADAQVLARSLSEVSGLHSIQSAPSLPSASQTPSPGPSQRKPAAGAARQGRRRSSLIVGADAQQPAVEATASGEASPGGVSEIGSMPPATPARRLSAVHSGVDDGVTARFVRLGKKVTDLQGETTEQMRAMQTTVTLLSQRLGMMESFLPKRLRRQVEKIIEMEMDKEAKEKEKMEEDEERIRKEKSKENKTKKSKKDEKEKKSVDFASREKLVETKEFKIDDDEQVPWQKIGEPDVRWSWCFQPRNEMGRDLALHFQTMEDERQEFEDEIRRLLDDARKNGNLLGRRPHQPHRGIAERRVTHQEAMGAASSADTQEEPASPGGGLEVPQEELVAEFPPSPNTDRSLDRISKRVDKVVLPQIAELADRMDRMVVELRDTKKASESKLDAKADKQQVQGLAVKVAFFDTFDPAKLESRIDSAEGAIKFVEQLNDRLAMQVRKAESSAVNKNDITKLWQEVSGIKVDAQKLTKSIQDVTTNSFNATQKLSIKMEEVGKRFEMEVKTLQSEKATVKDLTALSEKVKLLEIAIKSSSKALTESSGPEVNVVVKRIILGMEDKLMLLENKIQALINGGVAVGGDAGGGMATLQGLPVEQTEKLGQDIEHATQAVQKLKQEVGLSKADLDSVKMQLATHIDIAQRINVLVESVSPGEGESSDGAGSLTLSRVQVMIAAAARQLVAGSKWVTREAFDHRISEIQSQVQLSSRQLLGQVEEMVATSGRALQPPAAANGGLLPKVVTAKQAGGTLQLQYVEAERASQSARGPRRREDQAGSVAVRKVMSHTVGGGALPWPGR
ncbi:unnamed protein product [Prorocentrum cordatum]|uniref:Uncharacterized protein n=1 Tax=Prorocentrum cordatum TaxID=2364126 RepID=A0ABN9SHH1_9DINO|nr:unnamed protein product [Polarella glacialis]